MPSTRNHKAKERRLRQLDIMSDAEIVDVMLGSYSRNDEGNDHSENELNWDSESGRPQRNSILTGDDFRSLLTSSRENSEITIETARLINEEISNQMSILNEIKTSLNSQIQDAITSAITNTLLPFFQNTLEMQGRANSTMEDRRSSGLQRNSEAENAQKTWENRAKRCFTQENSRQMSRDSSVDSYTSEQNRDIKSSDTECEFGFHVVNQAPYVEVFVLSIARLFQKVT